MHGSNGLCANWQYSHTIRKIRMEMKNKYKLLITLANSRKCFNTYILQNTLFYFIKVWVKKIYMLYT